MSQQLVIRLNNKDEDPAALRRRLEAAGFSVRTATGDERADWVVQRREESVPDSRAFAADSRGAGASPTERALRRQRDFYSALSEFNQLVVLKTPRPESLYEHLCRVCVDYARLSLAWVGVADEAGWVRPAASRGEASDYLHHARMSVDGNMPEGRGPTGTAMREGRQVIVQALCGDASMGPWQRAAYEAGLRSSAAFPISRGGDVVASLNVYASEEGYFTADLVHLLDELVLDAAFALDNYERQRERQRLVEILEATPDFVGIADPAGKILYHNPAARKLLNQTEDLGRIDDVHTEAARHQVRHALSTAAERGVWAGETEFVDSAGTAIPFSQVIIAHHNEHGEVTHFSTVARDVSSEKASEEKIRQLAYQDALTGLANRTRLIDHLELDHHRALRHGRFGALLYMDVDEFKAINDSLGHAVGDAVLAALAERFSARSRAEDTLARIGGDEFVLLVDELGADAQTAAEAAQAIAEQLVEALRMPIEVHGYRLHVSVSVGVALFPGDVEAPMEVLRQADTAMYASKRTGRGGIRFYDPAMGEHVKRRLDLEQELKRALETQALNVRYQPIVALPDQTLLGFEALVRWAHPDLGNVSPAEFIPIAERTGQIVELGELVMRQALNAVRSWIGSGLLRPGQQVSVNVSPRQFAQPDFVDRIRQLLDEYGVPGERLNLEITESVVIRGIADTTDRLRALQAHGIMVALDDFGTGYSSLSYLAQLPLQVLKVDRAFIRDLGGEQGTAGIVEAILAMAGRLGLSVVAEGVEQACQLEHLRASGCNAAQGYYFARPLSEAEAAELLAAQDDR